MANVGLKIRMVHDIDLDALQYRKYDGKSVQSWLDVKGRGCQDGRTRYAGG
jgi:hypothetical protein